MTDDEMLKRAREVFDVEIKGLEATRDSLGKSFTDAVRLILDVTAAGGIVVVSGVGKNLHVAEKMSAIFSSTGTRSIVLNPVQAMHGDLGMVSAKDLLLALSFSGESAEVNNLIPAIRRHGLKVISMTGNAESTLAKLADIHLAVPCGREACPFGMAPTNSTTATMAMGDALAMVLIDAQRFKIEDYAMNHPAGAIGRALVMKVSDIMRTGDKLAIVPPTATVMDALMAMTAAKGGSAVIADADCKLLGIFTDGDFRRMVSLVDAKSVRVEPVDAKSVRVEPVDAKSVRVEPVDAKSVRVEKGRGKDSASTEKGRGKDSASTGSVDRLMSTAVGDVMTRSPLFVRETAYAADLLKIFEKKRIDDLPVCDAAGRVVGLVDIQDLPKMKVL